MNAICHIRMVEWIREITLTGIGTKACMTTYIHVKQWDVITHPGPNSNASAALCIFTYRKTFLSLWPLWCINECDSRSMWLWTAMLLAHHQTFPLITRLIRKALIRPGAHKITLTENHIKVFFRETHGLICIANPVIDLLTGLTNIHL